MPSPLNERLIQRQINHWNRLRDFLESEPETQAEPPGPVITVSRLAGSGGRSLARLLAERLDLELHDQSLVDRIAHDRDLERSVVARLDEKTVSQVRLWVRGALEQRMFMTDDYHRALVRVVTSLAAAGDVVFLGRGANLILGERADLRVRVVASHRTRCERLRRRRHLGKAESRALLDQIDAQRAGFVRRVFHTEPGLPENFDIILNSDRMDRQAMADQVMAYLAATVAERRAAMRAAT